MRISDIEKELAEIKAAHGDLDIWVDTDSGPYKAAGFFSELAVETTTLGRLRFPVLDAIHESDLSPTAWMYLPDQEKARLVQIQFDRLGPPTVLAIDQKFGG